ncbi:molybdenum cofactor biosynthesis enzyme MoaA [Bradyrhizobium ottawaense]|uniref:hypothetical protein n=1 Tax=Bradyrhizobium ottawaense TaxID=931866 RepID=UPI0038328EFA
MKATPLPILGRSRDPSFWQSHWRKRQPDAELAEYAEATELKKWFAKQIVDLSPIHRKAARRVATSTRRKTTPLSSIRSDVFRQSEFI